MSNVITNAENSTRLKSETSTAKTSVSFLNHREDETKTVLEVAQIFGQSVVDIKHFDRKRIVTIGSEMGNLCRFGNRPIAWVPDFMSKLSWCMYPFVETQTERKTDFQYPIDGEQTLFDFSQAKPICYVQQSWTGFIERDGQRTTFKQLILSGKISLIENRYLVHFEDTDTVCINTGKSKFIAQKVPKAEKIPTVFGENIDGYFIALVTVIACIFAVFGSYIHTQKEVQMVSIESSQRFAEATAELRLPVLSLEEIPQEELEDEEMGGKKDAEQKSASTKPNRKTSKRKGAKGKSNKGKSDKAMVKDLMNDLDFETGNSLSINNKIALASAGNLSFIGTKSSTSGSITAGSSVLGQGSDNRGLQGAEDIGKNVEYQNESGSSEKKKANIVSLQNETVVVGSLDRSLIQKVITNNIRSIRYCYSRVLQKNPGISGKVSVRFIIGKDGSVARANIKKSTIGSKAVEDCIISRFKRFQFDKPKKGGIVIVTYPFAFHAN